MNTSHWRIILPLLFYLWKFLSKMELRERCRFAEVIFLWHGFVKRSSQTPVKHSANLQGITQTL